MNEDTVRTAIANAAATIPNLMVSSYFPDSIVPDHFVVAESERDFDRAMGRGMDVIEFTCRIFTPRADDMYAQKRLCEYTSGSGTRSLKAAIEAIRVCNGGTAGSGAFDDLHVTRIQSHRLYPYGSVEYLGAEVIVRVIGSGD